MFLNTVIFQLTIKKDYLGYMINCILQMHKLFKFLINGISVVLFPQLEIALGMGAHGADCRSLGANHDMSAVAALPDLYLAALKDLGSLHVVQQCTVALLMGLFNGGHASELLRQLVEALLVGLSGHALIHIRPLKVLAFCSVEQVLSGIAQLTQLLEPELGVLLLIVSRLLEQLGYLLKAALLGSRGKIGVFISRLGFAGKSLPKIFLGLGACIFVSHVKNSFRIIGVRYLKIPIFSV